MIRTRESVWGGGGGGSARALVLLSAILLACASSARAQVHFSLDRFSPTVQSGACQCSGFGGSYTITEGDILVPHLVGVVINPNFPCNSPLPTCTPGMGQGPGTPGVAIWDAAPLNATPGTFLWLGLNGLAGCHGVDTANACPLPPPQPPGYCKVEVDAFSSGFSALGMELLPSNIKFSVDRLSTGAPNPPTPYLCIPSVDTEAPAAEAHADIFATVTALTPGALPPFAPGAHPPLGNAGVTDGAGCRNVINGYQYPGSGLPEPNLPDSGDNLDALEVEEFDLSNDCGVFISLDPATAAAHGVSPADILWVDPRVGAFTVLPGFSAQDLGLDPLDDDVNALAIGLEGDGPCEIPLDEHPVGILYSVTRVSAIVGTPDTGGFLIQPGDILLKPPQGSGQRPKIYIPAEMLGLLANRDEFSTLIPDDLDAMAFAWNPTFATIVDCTGMTGNGIEDGVDIALGTEIDCDANGIPDSCEIAADPSLDEYPTPTTPDGILDQCQGTHPQMDTYCYGDGTGGGTCICGNFAPNLYGGCENSTGFGAVLSGYGSRWTANQACLPADGPGFGSLSRLVLTATEMPDGEVCIFFQGDQMILDPGGGPGGMPFGDGLRCAGTNVIQLQTVTTDSLGTASTTVDIAAKGQVQVGQTKYYQARYRDPTGPCSYEFNLTNGLRILWDPPN